MTYRERVRNPSALPAYPVSLVLQLKVSGRFMLRMSPPQSITLQAINSWLPKAHGALFLHSLEDGCFQANLSLV